MCLLWGIPYLLIKVAVHELSPPVLVFARTAGAAALLLPIAAVRGQLRPLLARWRPLVAFAALELALPWLFLARAERSLSSSLTGLLVAAVPMAAALASRLLGDDDRLDRIRLLGLVVGAGGVAVLLGLDLGGQGWAVAAVAVVVVGYATGPLIISHYLSDVPALGVIAASLGLTALVFAPFAAASWPAHLPSAKVLSAMAVLVLACTVTAFLVFFALIAEAGPQRALVITFVNPAVAVGLGVALLGEHLTAGLLLGSPLILLGCLLATRRSAAVTTDADTPDAGAPAAVPVAPGTLLG